jgi:hypothetical protein
MAHFPAPTISAIRHVSRPSRMSIQETIPRPAVGSAWLHADLPADGRWKGGGTPPARLNATPVHREGCTNPGSCRGSGNIRAVATVGLPVSRMSIQETIPQSSAGTVSLHAHLPGGGAVGTAGRVGIA